VGWLRPIGETTSTFSDIINCQIDHRATGFFSTIVVGIAGAGALKRVVESESKALIFFEIVYHPRRFFIGLAVVNSSARCGRHSGRREHRHRQKRSPKPIPKTFVETIVTRFHRALMTRWRAADVLQIGRSAFCSRSRVRVGEKGQPIVRAMESLAHNHVQVHDYVMMFAPIGVGAAMAQHHWHPKVPACWSIS